MLNVRVMYGSARASIVFMFIGCLLSAGICENAVAQRGYRGGGGSAAKEQEESPADVAWKKLEGIKTEIGENELDNTVAYELFRRELMEEGIKFWNDFPGDPRKYKWLKRQLSEQPEFWLDARAGAEQFRKAQYYSMPIDMEAFNRWESLKREMISSALQDKKSLTSKDYMAYHFIELASILLRAKNSEFRKAFHDYPTKIKTLLDAGIERMDESSGERLLRRSMELPFISTDCYDLSLEELKSLVRPYVNNNVPAVREWAKQRMALLDLQDHPFDIAMKDGIGHSIDFKQLRGKVVLIDFWNRNCSICISRMYGIKNVYDRYKKSGFEVVSVSTDPEEHYEAVKKIKERVGADWPVVLLGGKTDDAYQESQGNKVMAGFGFMSVPQLVLLDKEGKMVMLNGSLQVKDFGNVVEKLLKD